VVAKGGPGVPAHAPGDHDYVRVLIALPAAGVATFIQLYAIQGILPRISTELSVPPSDAGLTVSAATAGISLALLPWAFAADRIGRVRVMSISLIAAAIVGLAGACAPTFESLVVLRCLEGAALGGVPAIAVTYINERVRQDARAFAVGIYIAGTTLGGLLGRVLIGQLSVGLDWRSALAAVTGVAAVAAAVFLVVMPRRAISRVAPVTARAVARAVLRPHLLVLCAQGFLLMGGFVVVYNYLAFRLEAPPFDLGAGVVGLVFLAYLAGTVSAPAATVAIARCGRGLAFVVSTGAMAVGLGLTLAPFLPIVITGVVLITAGFFAAHAIASGWAPIVVPAGRAQASALYNIAYYAGSSLMGWLGGLAFDSAGWPGLTVVVAALLVTAAALTGVNRGTRQHD
jgi:YNFM family putative membrane transporter